MSDDFNDKYPHWKDALLGNDGAIANLRCAIHYIVWHTVYGGLAVVAFLLVGAIKSLVFIGEHSGPLSTYVVGFGEWLKSSVVRVVKHPATFYVGFGVTASIAVACLGIALYQIITMGLDSLLMLAKLLVTLIIFAVIGFGLMWFGEHYISPLLGRAGKRAKETPGIRRIYGNCPVSISQPPRWFNKVFPDDE